MSIQIVIEDWKQVKCIQMIFLRDKLELARDRDPRSDFNFTVESVFIVFLQASYFQFTLIEKSFLGTTEGSESCCKHNKKMCSRLLVFSRVRESWI